MLVAVAGYKQYQWQDGTTNDSITVTGPGFYKIIARDSCGNTSADSIQIKNTDTSLMLPALSNICLLDTAYLALPSGLYAITWLPFGNGILKNNKLLLYPSLTTTYSIKAYRYPACEVNTMATVIVKTCPDLFFFPNAFTPNNDGKNDQIKPSVTGRLQAYHISIYNRYGQKVFESSDPSSGWDGKINGSPQNQGAFTWQVNYQFNNRQPVFLKGSFLLIR